MKSKRENLLHPHYRWLMASRIFAAVAGGYVFATAMTVLLTYLLPMPQKDALMLATILSYIIYPIAIIRVFSVTTVRQAWIEMSVAIAVVASLALALRFFQ